MKTLLITTGSNRVTEVLSASKDVELNILDLSALEGWSKTSFLQQLKEKVDCFKPQLLISWRCPHIIPESIFSIPEYGSYNLHPSLLPKYKGMNPWEKMYAAQETEGGVTLHRLSTDVDGGEILLQRAFTLSGNLQSDRRQSDKTAAEIISIYMLGLINQK
ncbi:MAG: formyltransferase family protein [Candidatus Cryptobacteroides sp.]